MSEMVERVGRVISSFATKHDPERPSWINVDDIARAVIEAMREPTEEMWSAAARAADHGGTEWQAMIDAALGQKS